MIGLGGSGRPFIHLRSEKAVAEKCLARHFTRTLQALGKNELHNVQWLPYMVDLADGLTRGKSSMASS